MSPNGLLNAILGLRRFSSDNLTELDYERAILGEHFRNPAAPNLYTPEHVAAPAKPGSTRVHATDREVFALFPKAEPSPGWSWERGLTSLERATRAGNLLAVLDGLKQFNRSDEHVPPWLLLTAARWVLWLLVTDGGRHIGRHGNPLAAAREELTHHMRCYAIELALTSQRHVRMLVKISKALGRPGRPMLEAMLAEQKLVGKTETSAVRLAVKYLEGLPWAGSESALTRSYRRFRTDLAFQNRVWNPTPELLYALKLPLLPAILSH